VTAAVASILKEKGRLDALVNNAGYAQYGSAEEVSLEDAQRQFDVNVFGLMRMTQAVLPTMRRQRSGVIVNLSSAAGKISTPFAGWYSASKHAVEALSDALRAEVAPFAIRVVLIEPGAIRTEFDDIALSALHNASRIPDYQARAAAFDKLIQNSYRRAPGPSLIAQVVERALAAPRPRARYALPADSRLFILMRRLLSDSLFDRLLNSQIRA
jgi:short-subunit dehydrogenase